MQCHFSFITLLFYFFVKNALIVIRVGRHHCNRHCNHKKIQSQSISTNPTTFTQVFAKEVVDKVTQISLFETYQSEMKVIELDKEKSRTEMAFHDFVPPAVVKRIKSKKGKEV